MKMKLINKYILLLMLALIGWTTSKAVNNNTISVGVMLPLHQVDGDGKRMVEYDRGILLAFKQLKTEGYHVDL